MSYGTARGVFSSVYRSLIIQVEDVTEFVSFGFNIYSTEKTVLAIALHDSEIVELFRKLIGYALVRDQYRKGIKKHKDVATILRH